MLAIRHSYGKGDVFFFQAEDGIRYLVRSRGLGDVYKRQRFAKARCRGTPMEKLTEKPCRPRGSRRTPVDPNHFRRNTINVRFRSPNSGSRSNESCLLYTSDAADERSSVDLGGRRIIKKKKNLVITSVRVMEKTIKEEDKQ